jgi:single-stranded-DNA-specific exonuclease
MRWTIKPKPSEDKIKHLAQALHVEDFVATLLVQRGLKLLKTPRTSFVLP